METHGGGVQAFGLPSFLNFLRGMETTNVAFSCQVDHGFLNFLRGMETFPATVFSLQLFGLPKLP